jgi:hypothetical protein
MLQRGRLARSKLCRPFQLSTPRHKSKSMKVGWLALTTLRLARKLTILRGSQHLGWPDQARIGCIELQTPALGFI